MILYSKDDFEAEVSRITAVATALMWSMTLLENQHLRKALMPERPWLHGPLREC